MALSAGILGLAPMLLLAACTHSATPTPPPPAITFAFPDDDLGYYEALAQAFQADHPNLSIRLLPKRPAALAALGPADADAFVVSLPIEPLLARGVLLDLTGQLSAGDPPLKDDLFPYARDAVSHDGHIWALPTGVDPVLLFYNRTLFDSRGIPYPDSSWDWDGFLHTAQALRDASQGIYGYAAALWRQEPWLFILQHGGRLVDNWQHPTRLALDDPQTIEAMQWYADLMLRLDVAPSPQEARQAFGGPQGTYGGVLAGKIGMWAGHLSSRMALASQATFDWGVTVLPHDQQAATLANIEAVAISPQTQRLQEAWEWIRFLSAQVPLRMAPARRSLAASPAFEQKVGHEVASATRAALEQACVLPHEPAALVRQLDSAWAQALDDILNARWAPGEALRQAQQKAK